MVADFAGFVVAPRSIDEEDEAENCGCAFEDLLQAVSPLGWNVRVGILVLRLFVEQHGIAGFCYDFEVVSCSACP
jgi:hypothetical protein